QPSVAVTGNGGARGQGSPPGNTPRRSLPLAVRGRPRGALTRKNAEAGYRGIQQVPGLGRRKARDPHPRPRNRGRAPTDFPRSEELFHAPLRGSPPCFAGDLEARGRKRRKPYHAPRQRLPKPAPAP